MSSTETTQRHGADESSAELESFVKGFFFGAIQEDLVIPFPEMDPSEVEELEIVLSAFRRFAEEKIDAVAIDQAAEIPREVIRGLAEMGVFGLTIPEEYDGLGVSYTAYCKFMELVSRYCAATAATIGGHQSIGTKGIIIFGTEEQKRRFLPRLATGEHLAAFALTEPQAGSDAGALKATAVWDESEGVYILNGTKQWITNGGLCDILVAFARTPDLGTTQKGRDITAFIVEMSSEGVTRGNEEHKMGIKGSSTTEISFQNVKVPAENILGEKGEGFKVALTILNTGRLSLGAGCVGAAKKMLEDSIEHARTRQQFDTYLKDFELIHEKLAEMATMIYAMESTAYLTSGLADRGIDDFACESAISKTFCSERLWDVVNHAVQINGGNGFITEYPYERFLRDSRINMIFEGTNEIQRLFIAGTGLRAPAKALREMASEMKKGSIGALASFAKRRITRVVSKERFERIPDILRAEAEIVEAGVRELAIATEKALMHYKKELPKQEFVLERIADATIDLYVMTACLARATSTIEKLGAEGAEREIDLTRLFCAGAGRRVRRQWKALESNQDELVRRVSDRACADVGDRMSA
jgi:acyl-CoA dehydrogenase family protein 9